MATLPHLWSIADGSTFLGQDEVTTGYVLNDVQADRVREAWGLWADISGFTPEEVYDDVNLARAWDSRPASVPNHWTCIAGAEFDPEAEAIGLFPTSDDNDHYHEIYIEVNQEGGDTFVPGSTAFSTVVHELGHAIIGDHFEGAVPSELVLSDKTIAQDASTPMPFDIDRAAAIYGPATTTRTGDDTYGFNARFSGPYREAFDFTVNKEPLVTIFDNAGDDTLDASGFVRPVRIDLNSGTESWFLDQTMELFAVIYRTTEIENAVGSYFDDDEIYGNYLSNVLTGLRGNDKLFGGAGIDYLSGGAHEDTLFGGTETDYLWGDEDNDTLNGEGGDDVMLGGSGDDNYAVDDAGDQVFELEGNAEGTLDKIYTTLASYDMREWDKGVWVEHLQYVGTDSFVGHGNGLHNALVGGTGWDTLHGYGGNDWLVGGEGRDTLHGGDDNDLLDGEGDADTMYGGIGDDTYYVDHGRDNVSELIWDGASWVDAGSINDTIVTTRSRYDLSNEARVSGFVENLTYNGAGSFTGSGDGRANVITGGGKADVLSGGGGEDTLYGNGGRDTLDGGADADHMIGGLGNDTYIVSDVGDRISESPRGGGIDTVLDVAARVLAADRRGEPGDRRQCRRHLYRPR